MYNIKLYDASKRARAKISQILSSCIISNFGDGIVSGIILILICNLLFSKRPFGIFDTSVSGLPPTFGGSSSLEKNYFRNFQNIESILVCI